MQLKLQAMNHLPIKEGYYFAREFDSAQAVPYKVVLLGDGRFYAQSFGTDMLRSLDTLFWLGTVTMPIILDFNMDIVRKKIDGSD